MHRKIVLIYFDVESPIELVIVDVELIFGFKIVIIIISCNHNVIRTAMTSVISSPSVCFGKIE